MRTCDQLVKVKKTTLTHNTHTLTHTTDTHTRQINVQTNVTITLFPETLKAARRKQTTKLLY